MQHITWAMKFLSLIVLVMNGLELVDVWKSTMKQLNVLKVTLGQLGQKLHHVTANLLTRFFKQICTLSLQLVQKLRLYKVKKEKLSNLV
ncbi:Uncharacterised protein [Acinetobacter baumannii]|nr:Uncharacterised protein [Acinetobacter baumannii]